MMKPITDYIGTSADVFAAFRINYEILDAFPQRRNDLLTRPLTCKPLPQFFLVHGGVRFDTPTTTYISDCIDAQNEFLQAIYKVTSHVIAQLKDKQLPPAILKKLENIKNRETTGEDKFLELINLSSSHPLTEEYKSMILQYAFFTHTRRFQDSRLRFFLNGHTHIPACFQGANPGNSEKTRLSSFNLETAKTLQLDDEHAWFLNPGSVG
ncbi:MAG: hypothetical protein GY940_12920, partial [bacterium]|nr:hypothetical protein [bacterium]